MTASAATACYAVVGNPVTHSLSPKIHAEFAAQTNQQLSYQAIELPGDGFAAAIRELQQQNFKGVNVTVPFKREAWDICDHLTQRAEIAGAVNTLSFSANGDLAGDNTDGVGLTRDLVKNLAITIDTRKILLLGAGGAVRGVLDPLLALNPASIAIANRNLEKAEALVRDFGHRGELSAVGYDKLTGASYDLIINATAAGLHGEIPPIDVALLNPATICYDMMYNLSAPTAFVAWATEHSVSQAYDGLGMLVEQAAEAFELWRRIRPDSVAVIESLRRG